MSLTAAGVAVRGLDCSPGVVVRLAVSPLMNSTSHLTNRYCPSAPDPKHLVTSLCQDLLLGVGGTGGGGWEGLGGAI